MVQNTVKETLVDELSSMPDMDILDVIFMKKEM